MTRHIFKYCIPGMDRLLMAAVGAGVYFLDDKDYTESLHRPSEGGLHLIQVVTGRMPDGTVYQISASTHDVHERGIWDGMLEPAYSDFDTIVMAKHGIEGASKKIWDFFYPAVKGRIPDESDAVLVFCRKLELFNPSKVKDRAGWKFSELLPK